MMQRLLFVVCLCFAGVLHFGCANTSHSLRQQLRENHEQLKVAIVLDSWHFAARFGLFDLYFEQMSEDAVFMGTDATERWTKAEFMDYARDPFDDGHGWTYESEDRHIDFSPDRRTAWVDEQLTHESYGRLRGTAVLIKDDEKWVITHYSLTFLVPNEKAKGVVELIGQP